MASDNCQTDIIKCCSCFYHPLIFSPHSLRGFIFDHHQTLPCVRWWLYFIKFGPKFGGSRHWKIWWPKKNSKFWRDFGKLRDLIPNISRLEQDIVERKRAFQTVITPIHAYRMRWTLVCKRQINWPLFWPTKNQLFQTFTSQGLKGIAP